MGGEKSSILAIQVCAVVQGMVFRSFGEEHSIIIIINH